MVKAEFRRALDAAETELGECLRQQHKLEKRILVLRQTISSLLAALNEGQQLPAKMKHGSLLQAMRDHTLMDDIRAIFRAKNEEVLNAQDIVEELEKLGRDMDKYANQLATVGVMLGRLKEKGEIINASEGDKKGFSYNPRSSNHAFYGDYPPIAAPIRRGPPIIAERRKKKDDENAD